MTLMRYRDLIENITPDLENKFGRVLFGDWQYKNGIRPDHEKDTEYEEQIFQDINDWYNGGQFTIDSQRAMIELSKLKDNYPTLLKPNPSSKFPYLYRGMDISMMYDQHKRFFRRGDREVDDEQPINFKSRDTNPWRDRRTTSAKFVKAKEPINYKPRRTAESWTVSLKLAIDMSVNHFGRQMHHTVIVKAKVPDEERLFKIQVSNKLYPYMKQYEIIRVSEKPIEAELFYLTDPGDLDSDFISKRNDNETQRTNRNRAP